MPSHHAEDRSAWRAMRWTLAALLAGFSAFRIAGTSDRLAFGSISQVHPTPHHLATADETRMGPAIPGEAIHFDDASAIPAGDRRNPDVSPRLRAEIGFLRAALHESLEGQPPMEPVHARFMAGWVFNMMLDAAYQDALELGRGIDPRFAKAQVLEVLDAMEAPR